jgi:hypothetical protein
MMDMPVIEQVFWPVITRISAPKLRTGFLGGSDANIIFGGNRERIDRLWKEKRGEVPWTEEFNRQWFERVTGQRVCRDDGPLTCVTHAWRSCNLDGLIVDRNAVWEAKHTGAFTKSDEVLERYMPQLQHNMAVTKSELAVLSVIFGNHKFEVFEVASDWVYQMELLEAELDFWNCVQTGREPTPYLAPPSPKPVGIREVCLEGNNAWASAAADWIVHREAAKRHAASIVQIKDLVEPDVARAFGHGVEAKRSKSGAISIKEMAL